MSAAASKLQKFGRLPLIGLCCAVFVLGCERSQHASQPSSQDESSQQTDVPNQTLDSESAPALETPTTADAELSPTPTKTKALDLSRAGLDSLNQATSTIADDSRDTDNLLPDLFDDKSAKSGVRASGRVMLKEDEKASIQAIEGVEFKLEVPVN